MSRKIANTLIAFAAAVLLSSCASSKRAMRISPFAESGSTWAGDMSEQRVNLWPLAYHQEDATSILWPIMDIDDAGFAVRPVFNKENDDYSILFPLCAWNSKEGDGWVLTFYRDNVGGDAIYGCFPFFHAGNHFKYIGPAWWWTRHHKVRSWGIFPLMAVGRKTAYIGPFWKDGKWKDDDTELGVFPLAYWRKNHDAWLFPLYRRQEFADDRGRFTLGLGTLAYLDKQSPSDWTHWIAPAYFSRQKNDRKWSVILPLWFSHVDGEKRNSMLLPFGFYSRDAKQQMIVTPLGGRAWTSGGQTRMRNILGPVYHWHKGPSYTFSAFAWPLLTMRRDHKSKSYKWASWPLGTVYESSADESLLIALFGAYGQELQPSSRRHAALWGVARTLRLDNATSWQAWPLARVSHHDDSVFADPLQSCLINYHRTDSEKAFFLTPLFGKGDFGDRREWRLLPLAYHWEKEDRSISNYMLLSGKNSSPDWKEWYALPFLGKARGDATRADDFGVSSLAFYSHRQDPRKSVSKLGYGLLHSAINEKLEHGREHTTRIMTLWQQSEMNRERKAVLEEACQNPNQFYGDDRTVKSQKYNLFPLFFSRYSRKLEIGMYSTQQQRLTSRWLRWLRMQAHQRLDEPRRQKLDFIEDELLKTLRADPLTADLVQNIRSSTPEADKQKTIKNAVASSIRNYSEDTVSSSIHIPLIFKSRKRPWGDKTSALVLWHTRKDENEKDKLIFEWAEDPLYKRLGRLKSTSKTLFPLWFSDKQKTLKFKPGNKKLLEAAREWGRLQNFSLYNIKKIKDGKEERNRKLRDVRKKLLKILQAYPEAEDLTKQAVASDQSACSDFIIRKALEKVAANRSVEKTNVSVHIPLIFKGEYAQDSTDWKLLFGAMRGVRRGKKKRFSILRYLYRREKTPERIYRDFFPFVSWNSASEKADFSFLWRVFHIRREGKDHSGHILFIPFD